MRILWHSAAPWMPTGYGQQTALWARKLRDAGHEVAISAHAGLQSGPLMWEGLPVYPGTPYDDYGQDVAPGHYKHWRADLLISLHCVWRLNPAVWRDMRVARLCPVDCEPMSSADRGVLEQDGSTPIAISRFGERQMRAAGLEPFYVPHGLDMNIWKPPADRAGLRKELGVEGQFVIGINAGNYEQTRKGFGAQFKAFSQFRKRHPEARLAVHTLWGLPAGNNLPALAELCGIADAVIWSPQYEQAAGMFTQQAMADWYGALDVLSAVSWGEGFCLPVLEAQACGTPVVVPGAHTGPELVGPGWAVRAHREVWNNVHRAWWSVSLASDIARAYEGAWKHARERRDAARGFAVAYDADRVMSEHWKPVLDEFA